jgi:hypothetical protein
MKTVALVAFSGVQSRDVSGPLDVFAEANRCLLADSHLEWKSWVWSMGRYDVQTE